jgi:ABC-type nitrate/sulfonate/bicarbonate transport system substrate-binding protein
MVPMLGVVVTRLWPLAVPCLVVMACSSHVPAPVSIRIGHAPVPSFALFYLAEDAGLFEAQGVRVESIPRESGFRALDAAFSGALDVALVYSTPVTQRALAGDDIAVVGTLHRADRLEAVVTRAGSGIRTSADLVGHRVGFTPHTSTERLVDVLLEESGASPSSIQRVPGSPAQLLTLLGKGQVDAAALWAPGLFAAQHRPAEPVTVLTTRSHIEISMIAGRRQTLRDKREALVRLLRALVAAEGLARQDPIAIRRALHRRFAELEEEDLETIQKQARFEVRLSNLLLTTLRQEAVWLEQHGTARATGVRIRDIPDPQPLESVAPDLVTLLSPLPPARARP